MFLYLRKKGKGKVFAFFYFIFILHWDKFVWERKHYFFDEKIFFFDLVGRYFFLHYSIYFIYIFICAREKPVLEVVTSKVGGSVLEWSFRAKSLTKRIRGSERRKVKERMISAGSFSSILAKADRDKRRLLFSEAAALRRARGLVYIYMCMCMYVEKRERHWHWNYWLQVHSSCAPYFC